MNPEDVGRILDEIGERIGPAGEYAFELAVRQQVIVGALWTVFLAAVITLAATILIRSLRRVRSVEAIAEAVEAKVNSHAAESEALKKAVSEYRSAHEAARLEAMTAEQRKDWYDRWSGLGGYYPSFYGGSTASDVREQVNKERAPYYIAASVSGFVLAVASYSFVHAVQPLLNPEWKAIEALIGAIR